MAELDPARERFVHPLMVKTFKSVFEVLKIHPDFDEVLMRSRLNKAMANRKEREKKRLRFLATRIREPVGTVDREVFDQNQRFFVYIDRIGCMEIDLAKYLVIYIFFSILYLLDVLQLHLL